MPPVIEPWVLTRGRCLWRLTRSLPSTKVTRVSNAYQCSLGRRLSSPKNDHRATEPPSFLRRPQRGEPMLHPGHPSVVHSPRFGDDWWQRGIVYQIYPRSFADSDGNGVGDLPGIIDHLDHLGPAGLGVDAIWLSPIYPSPGLDLGYDVSDHGAIDPLFGTGADFDRLVSEAHPRGLRIILDLGLNHTSDQHPWFPASRTSRNGPYANWYLWRDPSGFGSDGEPLPPNNWTSYFGGPGWQWEPLREQFYFHTFLTEPPKY